MCSVFCRGSYGPIPPSYSTLSSPDETRVGLLADPSMKPVAPVPTTTVNGALIRTYELLRLVYTNRYIKFHIVLLARVEELSDFGCTFVTEPLGEDSDVVGQSGDFTVTLLDGEDGSVGTGDALMDGLALALTVATSAVVRVSIGEEEPDTQCGSRTPCLVGDP